MLDCCFTAIPSIRGIRAAIIMQKAQYIAQYVAICSCMYCRVDTYSMCGAPQRVAKLRAASSFGLPDGDLAALSLCALRLHNEDFTARQTNSNKLVCCD